MSHLTERFWTRITPWRVATSPVEGDIIEIIECAHEADAVLIVMEHNKQLVDPANCSDCGAPFNNADTPKHGKCPACYA